MLSVTEVSLQVIISFLKLLNLSESPSKFSLGVVVDPLLLLDLFFGPSSFGRDLHQVRGVALRNYGSQIQERLEIECNEILEFYIRMKCLPDTDWLALKIYAISGSMSIIMSCSALILSLRFCIYVLTHRAKELPEMVYITLAMYYLGSLSISFSIGK